MLQIVIIALLVAGSIIATGFLQKHLSPQQFRRAAWLIFAAYVLGNVYFTLLSRIPGSGTTLEIRPLQSYARMFESVDIGFENATGFAALFLKDTSPISGMVLNVLLYCPLGYFLPIVFPRLKLRHVVLAGFLCSVATEAVQYILAMGWCETDDVIHNTLGALAGVAIRRRQCRRMSRGSGR